MLPTADGPPASPARAEPFEAGSQRDAAAAATSESLLFSFLRAARRRLLLREVLGACALSAAVGLAYTYAVRVLNHRFALRLPELSVGLVLFLVLAALVLRRNRPSRVAREADQRLRLQDRLATFLDFRGRADVAVAFRLAQAQEAVAALPGAGLARGIPVPRLLWVAPLLFGWLLYTDFFEFFTPFQRVFQGSGKGVVQRRSPERREQVAGPDREAQEAGTPAEGTRTAPPPTRREAADNGAAGEPEQARRAGEDAAEAPANDAQQAARDGSDAGPAVFEEPPQLYSEPVTRALTPVVDSTGQPGEEPARQLDLPPRGRISFNIVPTEGAGEGPAGAGGAGGGKAALLRITVDYDAVPAEYRVQVRRYFEALVRLFPGRADGA